MLRKVLDGQLAVYRADPQAALRLLKVGETPRGEKFDPAELAAWGVVAGILLNLDETVTRN